MNKIVTVIGAGNSGLAMAAFMSIHGYSVRLWNRSQKGIKRISETKTIYCEGVYSESVTIELASTNIEECVKDSSLILVTTPASAHTDIAKVLSKYILQDSILILNPGRTLGAISFRNDLTRFGCETECKIAETQTIIFTCRRTDEDKVTILKLKSDVLISCENSSNNITFLKELPIALQKYLIPANSLIETSIGNVGMILHTAPVLLNIGWIEYENVDFKYYYNGITPTIAHFIEKMDLERVNVSKKLGYKVETLTEWLKRSYLIEGNSLFECLQNNETYMTIDAPKTLNHRYIFEDIPTGLVPVENIAKNLNIETPNISLIIDLACSILNTDFRKIGRKSSPETIEILTGGQLKVKRIKKPEFFRIGSVKIATVGMHDTMKYIMDSDDSGYICVANLRTTVKAYRDKTYNKIIEESLMNIPDGMPLVWLGRAAGKKNIHRVTGPDLFINLLGTQEKKLKHFLIGDTSETLEKLIRSINVDYLNKKIVNAISPPFRELSEDEIQDYAKQINENDIDIVWVALGAPKQDYFANRLCKYTSKAKVIGVGAAFRFYLGQYYHPPKIFRKLALTGIFWRFSKHPLESTIWYIKHAFWLFYFILKILMRRVLNG